MKIWESRWQEDRIGFHLKEVNPYLIKFSDQLLFQNPDRVFVPLCGKTLDLCWLTKKTKKVKLAILLQYIAKENKISVDEKELSQGMMQYATQYPGQEKEIIEYFKKNPSSIETIRGPILEEKVIKHISSQCNLVKTKLDKKAYEKLEKEVFEVKKG